MAWLKIIFNPFYSKIDAFDYDHETGAISNRRTAVQIDPALGVSLKIMCHALREKCLKIWDRKVFLCLVVMWPSYKEKIISPFKESTLRVLPKSQKDFSENKVDNLCHAFHILSELLSDWSYTINVESLTGRNHMFPYFWNVAETCNSMFPLCLRKSGPVPLYTQQRKREKTSRNR